MSDIATYIKGTTKKRYYKVDDPKKLPAIYIKETRLVSQSFVHKIDFLPRLLYRSGPTQKLPDLLPLKGYVRTTPKNNPLVEVPIVTPPFENRQDFPVLAYWHYGLGKSVAYTSDAGNPKFWSKRWAEDKDYVHFWEYLVEWAMRPDEKNSRLQMTTEYRDGKVKVVVEARDASGNTTQQTHTITVGPNQGAAKCANIDKSRIVADGDPRCSAN